MRAIVLFLNSKKNNNIELSVYIRPEAIEEIPDYNPKGWNNYPEVTPPENELMRIECHDGTCGAGAFVNGEWHEDGTDELPNVIRFRPWEG